MRLLIGIILGFFAILTVILGLPVSFAGGFTNDDDLSLSSPYDGHEVVIGETVDFTVVLTNSGGFSQTVVYATTIPTGTVFVASSENINANSYPVGMTTQEIVRSLTWTGTLSARQTQLFTFTLQVTSSGTLPGGDIPVASQVFNVADGQQIARQTIILDWPGSAHYLPIIFRNASGQPTPTPAPSPTPTPLPGGQIAPSTAGTLQSQSDDYNTALAGGGFVAGGDQLSTTSPEQWPTMSISLVQCDFMTLVYMINRQYLEYDTTSVGAFDSAYLVFRNNTAYPGPPAHSVEVYQGAWTELLTGTNEVDPTWWDAQGTLIQTVPGNTGFLPVTATVTIPAGYINAGGITKIALKTSTEDAAPALNSCFGGPNPGLGASVSLPYLYILP